MSSSVWCNLKGLDPEELRSKLVDTLMNMADKKYRAAEECYQYIFEQIDYLMQMGHEW